MVSCTDMNVKLDEQSKVFIPILIIHTKQTEKYQTKNLLILKLHLPS